MKTEASRRNMQSKFDQTSVYASDFNGMLVLFIVIIWNYRLSNQAKEGN